MRSFQHTVQQEGQPKMTDAIGILEGWIHQQELPVSWQLSQKERRVGCFLEWLSELTDCESLVVLNNNQEVIAGWNTKDEILSFLQENKSGWVEESLQNDVVLHGAWLPTADGEIALGMMSSLHLDREFLGAISEMLKTVIVD